MLKRLLFSTAVTTGLLSFNNIALAQNEADALRFSDQSPQGTARSIGIGGALGAIGGDFSSLAVNPAGIGVYRRSEFTFTPSIKIGGSSSIYTAGATDDNSARMTINNLGVVFTSAAEGRRYKNSKWKAASFGMGINRIADFNSNYIYSGPNNTSSASEVFYTDLLAYPGDSLNTATFAGLGYSTFLTNSYYDTAGNLGFYFTPDYKAGLNQTRSVQQRGGITDISFSFGGNYEEKLMLGATVGIPSIRYVRNMTMREEDATGNNNNDFSYFEYTESLKTTGTGINLKIGAIYNFTPALRGGLALHTPTIYSMTDKQTTTLVTNTEGLKNYLGYGPNPVTQAEGQREYNYSMTTPWKAVLSLAGIIGKHGFISADYEYVDYSSARFGFDMGDQAAEQEVNSGIKTMYKGASNLRIGGEARFDIVSLRAGFGYYGNPFKIAAQGSDRLTFSGGVGFRFDNIFLDLGYSHSTSTFREQPYVVIYPNEVVPVPSATVRNNTGNIALTFGTKF